MLMKIDTERLRAKLYNSCRAACFGEEFRRVYYDAYEVENASEEALLQIAQRMGSDPLHYQIEDERRS